MQRRCEQIATVWFLQIPLPIECLSYTQRVHKHFIVCIWSIDMGRCYTVFEYQQVCVYMFECIDLSFICICSKYGQIFECVNYVRSRQRNVLQCVGKINITGLLMTDNRCVFSCNVEHIDDPTGIELKGCFSCICMQQCTLYCTRHFV